MDTVVYQQCPKKEIILYKIKNKQFILNILLMCLFKNLGVER